MPAPWWERHPGRLEYELALLAAAGMAYTVDAAAKDRGLLRIGLDLEVPEESAVELTVTFPDLYPYVRPEVAAVDLTLAHHQHPFSKTLCLLGRSTRNWGTDDTLAWLLTEQLPVALRTGAAEPAPGPERNALGEERQAEPYSDYHTYAPAAMFVIDGSWSLPRDATCGDLLMAVGGVMPPADDPQQRSFGAVLEVRNRDGLLLACADERLSGAFEETERGRWSRLDAPLSTDDAKAAWAVAEAADSAWHRPASRSVASSVRIRAMVFPEETEWRSSGEGWLFVVREPGVASTPPLRKNQKGRNALRARQGRPAGYWFVRAGRAGPADLAARVPELTGLGDSTVLVVGVGALGGTIADQLARAGVGRLRLLDREVLEPGNQVRHAATIQHWGMSKALAGALVAKSRSPYVTTDCASMHLGGARQSVDEPSQAEWLDSLLEGIHLLVDATAELGLQHLLADAAAAKCVPYLAVSATNGAWGGMVARIRPDGPGCYTCLAYLLEDGSIDLPPASPSDFVQPPGCADPTFTGSGFDLDQVALHAVRVAVGELANGVGHYPRAPDDVSVLALRQPDGTPILASWKGYPLIRHLSCRAH